MEAQANNKLDDHRNMLMVSKKVSDFQLTNLKTWPLIVFDNVENVSVSYNFIDKEEMFFAGEVTFDFKFKNDLTPDDSKKKQSLSILNQWTKLLFYTDTKVSFKLKGQEWT